MVKYSGFLHRYRLVLLLMVSFVVRLVVGSIVELGNDEVYYINYALFPDLSHFDHPPMIGWFIQLFTFNLTFEREGWIRLAAVVSGTLCTLIIYNIGKKLADADAGWYAALLYTISFYGFVITGVFIMPDSPQMLFWLLAVLLILMSFEEEEKSNLTGTFTTSKAAQWFLLAGLSTGLALLSKYTSAFILLGTLMYFVRNREWFNWWYVYMAVIIAAISFTPVLLWNFENEFISFTFHSDRVELTDRLFRMDSFATEIAGQILYNNPFTFGLIIAALIALFTKKLTFRNNGSQLLVYIALPLILVFLGISLFRQTLPHWSGPAYVTLIPLAAVWLRQKTAYGKEGKLFPIQIKLGAAVTGIILILALLQLSYPIIFNKGIDKHTGKRLGWKDITLDLYGWKQLNNSFTNLSKSDIEQGRIDSNAVIISHRWFPAANLDYYVARPNGISLITLAPIERTHKYAWITASRGGYSLGMDAWFISSSYDFEDPHGQYQEYFTIEGPDTIPVYRKDLLVKYYYIWRLKDLKKLPPKTYMVSSE
jgi:4-amino-4-deoxy-L-arabinose transferase-like glycosyltransferase